MDLNVSHINVWAVIVSAVAAFMVGGLWYAAIFGKVWAQLHGFDTEQLKAMEKTQARTFGLFLVCDLVTATVLSLLILNLVGEPSALSGVGVAIVLWLGLGATEAAAQNAAHRKPLRAYLIDVTHHLVYLVVMGAIIGGWR